MESEWSRRVCAQCGGACCKSTPCAYAPSDFSASFNGSDTKSLQKEASSSRNGAIPLQDNAKSLQDNIRKRINEGRAVIDASDGRLIVRAPGLLDDGRKIVGRNRDCQQNADIHNTCVLLGKHGCLLPERERPLFGRLIMPHVVSDISGNPYRESSGLDGKGGSNGNSIVNDGTFSNVAFDATTTIVCDYPREETLRAIQDWLAIQELLIDLARELELRP